MNKFLLMPDALQCIDPNILTHIVLTTNEYQLYLDNTNYLLSKYTKIAEEDAILKDRLRTMIDFLIDNKSYKIIDNNLGLEFNKTSDYVEFLKKYLYNNRNIIACDISNFEDYRDDIVSYELNIINESIISKELKIPSKKNFHELITEIMIKILAEMSLQVDSRSIEDIHTMLFVGGLRLNGYDNINEQAFAGVSATGKTAGRLDALVRNHSGCPVSIIEAMKLSSFAEDNKEIALHINKLLNKYDTLGYKRNFMVIYFEQGNFSDKWDTYKQYMNDLNIKPDFEDDKSELFSFREITDMHNFVDIKVALSVHKRHDKEVEVIHFFCNFCPIGQRTL